MSSNVNLVWVTYDSEIRWWGWGLRASQVLNLTSSSLTSADQCQVKQTYRSWKCSLCLSLQSAPKRPSSWITSNDTQLRWPYKIAKDVRVWQGGLFWNTNDLHSIRPLNISTPPHRLTACLFSAFSYFLSEVCTRSQTLWWTSREENVIRELLQIHKRQW